MSFLIETLGTTPAISRSISMRRLVYVSRSLIDADPASLNAMVERSCARNAGVGITGMLWFDGTNFAQVLEGDDASVNETVQRIKDDPRHTDIDIVVDREVKSRAFGVWGMVQPGDSPEGITGTAFLVGISMSQHSRAAKRLHDIVVACEV